MRRVPLDRVESGAVLGKTLYNERGDVLLRRGAELTARYVDLLREKGFGTIYLHDPDTEDIDLDDIVSEHVRATATKNIYRFMQVVENASREIGRNSPERLLAAVGSGELRRELTGSAYEQLNKVVESIIDEVLDAATLSGMTALKTHDNYTFCHSVDVTITAIMLGKKLYFDRLRRVRWLGRDIHD